MVEISAMLTTAATRMSMDTAKRTAMYASFETERPTGTGIEVPVALVPPPHSLSA